MTAPAAPQFHIDSPASWRPEVAGLEVVGWLYPGEAALCVDVRARVDGRSYLGLHGLERPDTQQAFGGSVANQFGGETPLNYHDPLIDPFLYGDGLVVKSWQAPTASDETGQQLLVQAIQIP